jgi:DNA-binding NarL/FixJ family response regulator
MAGNLSTSGRIVLVATDLMRQSRVAEAARALGYTVAVATTAEEAREAIRGDAGDAAVVILDLQAEGLPWRDVVAAAGSAPVIAFGQHTKPDLLRAARAAGCRLAVPRSRLVEELPQLIEKAKGAA